MNARAVVTELAAKIRGPIQTPGAQPLQYTVTPVGPCNLGGFVAEVVFSFEDFYLVGKSAACATKQEAREEACEKIRADIQGIWDMRRRDAEPKLQIPCPIGLELTRPHSTGKHLMILTPCSILCRAGSMR